MRSYTYNNGAFARSVTFTGIFCALICLYSVWALLNGQTLFWICLLVGGYQVFNTFGSISNPKVVTISEDTISFSAYGKTHTYQVSEISSLRIKELDLNKKMYLRVNEPTMLHGRYWINCGQMNDSRELWERFSYLEYQIEPDQLKFRTRKPPRNPFNDEKDTDTAPSSID